MYDTEPRMIGRISRNHERRGPRLALTFFLGALSGIGGFAMMAATHEHPTVVEVKPDEKTCQKDFQTWLYTSNWPSKEESQQWRSFKSQMGDCVS